MKKKCEKLNEKLKKKNRNRFWTQPETLIYLQKREPEQTIDTNGMLQKWIYFWISKRTKKLQQTKTKKYLAMRFTETHFSLRISFSKIIPLAVVRTVV